MFVLRLALWEHGVSFLYSVSHCGNTELVDVYTPSRTLGTQSRMFILRFALWECGVECLYSTSHSGNVELIAGLSCVNPINIGVMACPRARVSPSEWPVVSQPLSI